MVVPALLSCTSDKEAQVGQVQTKETGGAQVSQVTESPAGQKTQYSLEISPAGATRNSTLSAVPKGFNVNDAKIEWVINGGPNTGSGITFKASETKKGDRIQAKTTIHGMEILSNIVEIGNTPPELTRVKFMPEVFKAGDSLYIEAAASDAGENAVTILYEWKKNGEPAGNGKAIGSPVKRGDMVSVKVTPFDGESYGKPIILERQIQNMPPLISEDKKINFDGQVLTCQLQAGDPDGDPLVYSLKAAPQGMTINPSTGLITWNVPRDFRGTASVTAAVNDGHGGEATHIFNIAVHP